MATTKTTKKTATTKKEKEAESTAHAVQYKRKILFVDAECTPYIVTGGMDEVMGSLSKASGASGKFDVRVVIPLYSDLKK